MYKSAYITDSQLHPYGHGGCVVSYHEHEALKKVTQVEKVYQRLAIYDLEKAYQQVPFVLDYIYASLIKDPEEIDIAQFYGVCYLMTMKMFSRAKKVATCPAHNLSLSLEEWGAFPYWSPPKVHLTDPVIFSWMNKGLVEEVDAIVTPSKSSAAFIKQTFNRDSVIIPHGADIPKKWSSLREGFKVLHIGQLGPDKGQRYLVTAWDILQGSGRLKGGEITFVSTPQFMDLVSNSPTLKVLSYIDQDAKNDLYSKSSVYVQPSITEGWGLPVGEAMAYGTPVIVTEGTINQLSFPVGTNGVVYNCVTGLSASIFT